MWSPAREAEILDLYQKLNIPHRNECDDSVMQLHIMECIGALMYVQNKRLKDGFRDEVLAAKSRIFWNTLSDLSWNIAEKFSGGSMCNSWSLLLENFPDSRKYTDGREWLSLHCASACKYTDDVDYKILCDSFLNTESGICVVDSTLTQRNAFHIAVSANQPNMRAIAKLSNILPRISRSNSSDGKFPLHYAAQYSSNVELVQSLLQSFPKGTIKQDSYGQTPLHCVCLNPNEDAPKIMSTLIASNPAPTAMKDRYGKLPLHTACFRSSYVRPESVSNEFVYPLISSYLAGVCCPDNSGGLPLHIACRSGIHISVVEKLVELYPEGVTQHSEFFGTPLHQAAFGGNLATLQYIYSLYPQAISLVDGDGWTPLIYSLYCTGNFNALMAVFSLNPSAVRTLSQYDESPLLLFLSKYPSFSPVSDTADIFRFLLHIYPEAASIYSRGDGDEDEGSKSPYDACAEENIYAKRLILRAAPTMHPQQRRTLNYRERRMAMFLFFSAGSNADESTIFRRLECQSNDLVRRVVGYL
mmetsp:Transcript_33369/g.33996  ORF Transcript_33369/g.33996 Transcript_33369/m.33996 type:complete len:528 (+) Transcript_33369:106-1689(+)